MTDHWKAVAENAFGPLLDLSRLDGEYDLNFRARRQDGEFILKIMRPDCPPEFIEMQIAALQQVKDKAPILPVPAVFPSRHNSAVVSLTDKTGKTHLTWALQALPGIPLARVSAKPPELLADLGRMIGQLDTGLAEFEHPYLHRKDKWDLLRGLWIREHLNQITCPDRRAIVDAVCGEFEAILPALSALPRQALHNDCNDYNVLVAPHDDGALKVSGLIDFGDMAFGPVVCEIAIAGAYAVLGSQKPEADLAEMVGGYHKARPLSEQEIGLVYPALRMRLAVSVVNSTLEATERPEDPYVTISQAPAWAFLERDGLARGLIEARLRVACGYAVTPGAAQVHTFLAAERGRFAPVVEGDLADAPPVNLSVAGASIPENPFELTSGEAAWIGESSDGGEVGGYGEPRLIYTAPAFFRGAVPSEGRRTVHIGVDVFRPTGTKISTPLAARVAVVETRTGPLDYGGMVVLTHETPDGDQFHSLYGHLDPGSVAGLAVGQVLRAGSEFACLGSQAKNGGWRPHLHFQLALLTDGLSGDWPGAVFPDELSFWQEVFPNPAALLNLPDAKVAHQPVDEAELRQARDEKFATNLKLSYNKPLMFLRGWKHHLIDQNGRPYLDAYNNVPHVGHAHPRIRKVACEQLARINSNTRYLHPAQTALAEKLTSKLPEPLSVCFFVNSGSEANELALRLARAHTGGKDMVVPDHGYHGNTTGAIDLSAYKFNKPNGSGQQDWIQLVEVADDYRGRFGRDDPKCGDRFASLIDPALGAVVARGGRLAGFIAETYPSVGGQIIPPPGYLRSVYARIRAAGGVCIADEVQTGLGRLGSHYFAFEEQGAVPDIVVLGKPLGNGHPVGAVITTPEIAASFANGIEFFSTFGGSTLSCLIAKEVLDIVDDEGLQENAERMGVRLLAGLRDLKSRFAVIGDVRGRGLFVGIDLVEDGNTRRPATSLAAYVLNRMRDRHILIGTEGPHDNILKIRPPLTIDAANVDHIVTCLGQTLGEV